MQKISAIIICLFFPVFLLAQQAHVNFSKVLHDFEHVKENNGPVQYDFIFKNTGNVSLSISSVTSGCECLTPVWTLSEVSPGEYGFVKVKFDPAGRPGTFVKSLTVSFKRNDVAVPIKRYLNIKGVVIPSTGMEDMNLVQIKPFIHFYRSGQWRIDTTRQVFREFIEQIGAIINEKESIKLKIEASASTVPAIVNKKNEEVALDRNEEAASKILDALKRKGFKSQHIRFIESDILVQGPPYDPKLDEQEFETYQYVKITAIDHAKNPVDHESSFEEFLKDSKYSTTVQISPKDIEALENMETNTLPDKKQTSGTAVESGLKKKLEDTNKKIALLLENEKQYSIAMKDLDFRFHESLKSDSLAQIKIEKLNTELEQLKAGKQSAGEEAEQFQKELAKKEAEISTLKEESEQLALALKEKEEQHSTAIKVLNSHFRETLKADSMAQLEMDKLHLELKELKAGGQSANNEAEQLQKELAQKETELAASREESNRLSLALKEKEQKHDMAMNDLNSRFRETEKADSMAQIKIKELYRELEQLKTGEQNVNLEMEQVLEELAQKKEEAAETSAELQKAMNELYTQSETVSAANEQIAELEEKITAKEEVRSIDRLTITELKTKLSESKTEQENLSSELQKEKELNEELIAELKKKNAYTIKSESDATALQSELLEKESMIKQLEKEKTALQTDLQKLQNKMAENEDGNNDFLLSELQKELQEALETTSNRIKLEKQWREKYESERKARMDAQVFAEEMKAITLEEIRAKEELLELVESDTKSGNQEFHPSGIFFSVQILLSDKSIPADSPKFKGHKRVTEYFEDDKYKYTVGREPNLNAAVALKEQLRKEGFDYAFVVAYKKGNRITLKEAMDITK